MTEKEQQVWRYVLDNRQAPLPEIAVACDVDIEFIEKLVGRIGSENWREEVPQSVRALTSRIGTENWRAQEQEVPLRSEILDTAKHYINVDRAATHGDAEDSFLEIAGHWSWWLRGKLREGERVDEYDVAQMMVGFKQARMKSNPGHLDSAQDMCGYGALAGEIGARNAKRKMEKP